MKHIKPASARTLTWLAAILLVTACIVISPSGALFLSGAAALTAFFPSVFSKGKVRLVAALLLLVSLAVALNRYPDFRKEQAAYRRHPDTSSQQDRRP